MPKNNVDSFFVGLLVAILFSACIGFGWSMGRKSVRQEALAHGVAEGGYGEYFHWVTSQEDE